MPKSPRSRRFLSAAGWGACLLLLWAGPILGGWAARRGSARSSCFFGEPSRAVLSPEEDPPPILAGYYPWYARLDGFLPGDLAAELLTHIHYAFAGIDGDGRVVLANPAEDRLNLAGLRQLREEHPGLSLLLSVGGWDYSENFSAAAGTEEGRRTFAESAAALVREQGLDGLDLDWEFPVAGGKEGNLHDPRDGENYLLLLGAVREALDRLGAEEGRRYLLAVALPPGETAMGHLDPAKMAAPADYFFLMGYDLWGPWDSRAGLNAPLYAPGEGPSVSQGVEGYLAAGLPPEQLVLGMPFYGYLYQTLGPGEEALGKPFRSARSVGYDTIVSRYLEEGTRGFSAAGEVPYLYGEDWFLSYDDPSSIAAKVRYAREKGLAGVGAWELSQDRSARLLGAAHEGLYR